MKKQIHNNIVQISSPNIVHYPLNEEAVLFEGLTILKYKEMLNSLKQLLQIIRRTEELEAALGGDIVFRNMPENNEPIFVSVILFSK